MKIAILGINGRMGRVLKEKLGQLSDINIAYGIDRTDINGKSIRSDLSYEIDMLVDFSNASFAYPLLKDALKNKIKVISGTTGYKREQISELKDLSSKYETSFVWVPNFALGASILYRIAEIVKDSFANNSILEIHNVKKLDAPSGTAKEYASLLNIDMADIQSLRINEQAANHEITFTNPGEKLVIRHEIFSQAAFLKGFMETFKKIKEEDFIQIIGLKDYK